MSDYEKHVDEIRKYFEEHKAERYPFENALLREKDEYVKSLYFRMLCTLVRYTGEPDEYSPSAGGRARRKSVPGLYENGIGFGPGRS